MAISKSAKIEAEIEKVKAKIAEQQARLKAGTEKAGGGKQRDRGHRAGHEYFPHRSAPAAPPSSFWDRVSPGGDCERGFRMLMAALCSVVFYAVSVTAAWFRQSVPEVRVLTTALCQFYMDFRDAWAVSTWKPSPTDRGPNWRP